MGSDLSVVNAARASFGKESKWAVDSCVPRERVLSQADANLIRFLATGYRTAEWDELLNQIISTVNLYGADTAKVALTNLLKAYKRKAQHWAPFAHPHVTIRINIPIFLARQFVKHQVGGVWSEESRRYISDEPGVWFPDEWHTRPEDIKQGSGGLIEHQKEANVMASLSSELSSVTYEQMLELGIAPEEARIVLPLNMMTTVVWTGSLLFWARVCTQRLDSHAQLAAQELAKQIANIVRPLYPVSWKELVE
jgi:thymidylate synthase (FAD)